MEITSSMLLNIILLTILSASFFPVSTTANTGDYGTYDPWIDYDDDGDMDLFDAVNLLNKYGAKGNATKTVNIAIFPLDEERNLKVTVIPTGNLTLCRNVQRIVLLENFEEGLGFDILDDGSWYFFYLTHYSFTPKKGFYNVTSAQVEVIASSSLVRDCEFSTRFGDGSPVENWCGFYLYTDPTYCFFTIDPYYGSEHTVALGGIKQDANRINEFCIFAKQPAIGLGDLTAYIHRVELLIEYTYWDYVG